jgi:hypothetical protein
MEITVGQVTFKGDAPYELPLACSANATATGNAVEILLIVPIRPPETDTILIRARIRPSAALDLSDKLFAAALGAKWEE